jgi:hypothetical protein
MSAQVAQISSDAALMAQTAEEPRVLVELFSLEGESHTTTQVRASSKRLPLRRAA